MVKELEKLHVPGPTPIPPQIRDAMNKEMISYKEEEFAELFKETTELLKPIFGTENDIFIIAGSGTSALETAIANTISPNDEVIAIITGVFGERFVKICERFGAIVHCLNISFGEACTQKKVIDFLKKYPNSKTIIATYCETSTTVLNPIKQLAKTIREKSNAVFIVDGVSCIGAVPIYMDEWGIDILVAGSQKALMIPPGLALISASKRAWKVIEKKKSKSFYFDLTLYKKSYENNITPFTPPVSLIYGLREACSIILNEGVNQVILRHKLMKNMIRFAIQKLGLPLFTNDSVSSPTVTGITSDENFDVNMLRRILKKDFNITCADAPKNLEGQLMRIGHMGWCFPSDIFSIIVYIELSLKKMDKHFDFGEGIKAAEQVYYGYIQEQDI